MNATSVPEIVIGENIHTRANVNVFKGTFNGKPAIHKYIEIYEPTTITSHTASLEIYKSLECENICKLLDYGVEEPSMPQSKAWETARSMWEPGMIREKNFDVLKHKWHAWDAWQAAKVKLLEEAAKVKLLEQAMEEEAAKVKLLEQAAEEEAAKVKLLEQAVEEEAAKVKLLEQAAEEEAKLNNLAWFNMKRTKIRITMEDCGTELMRDRIHLLMIFLTPECFINTILQIAHDVLSAIICLNEKKLFHCDIKVDNVVIYEQAPETSPAAPSPPSLHDLLKAFPNSAAADAAAAAPSLPPQDTKPCPMIKAKLIDMDSIGYIDAKTFTTENYSLFKAYFDIENVLFNIPEVWVARTSSVTNLKTQTWSDSKGYIDIFSWCIVCLYLLLLMGTVYFKNMKDEKGIKMSSFKNSGPNETLSQNLAFVKAYILESLISDMCLPDIKIDDKPKDKSLGKTIDVEYCKKVALFLLWLKDVEKVDELSFPVKRRQEWWRKNKLDLINHHMIPPKIPIGLVGEKLGGGYNKSNRGRDIRKNKHHLSKRLKKRKYKRTYKRKYKRTHKRKYKKTNKTIKL